MRRFKEELREICSAEGSGIAFDVQLSRLSTMRVGGKAMALAEPSDIITLSGVLSFLSAEGIGNLVLGAGSNLLFPDGELDLVVLRLSRGVFSSVSRVKNTVKCGAGVTMARLLSECSLSGLSGLEGLVGIPATVGGAIIMNASGKTAISDRLKKVRVLYPDGKAEWIGAENIDFSYRHSGLEELGVVLEAEFSLDVEDPAMIKKRLRKFMLEKISKQPLDKRTLGCVFRNPSSSDRSAGMMIDEAGLKNSRVGGAVISGKHANFIVNENNASCGDVLGLMDVVARNIRDRFSVELEPEIRII